MKARREEDYEERGADEDMDDVLDYEDVKGKVGNWVQRKEVVLWIRRMFDNFLRTFKEENGVHTYENRIHEMCLQNK